MPSLQEIDQWLYGTGPWLAPLVGLATFVEYVLPPFPGDTVTLAGTALAVRGALSPVWLMVATSVGSIAGMVVDYAFGAWLQRRVVAGRMRQGRFLSPESVLRLEAAYRRWGAWLILSNRFVPVARAVFFVFAGMSGLSFRKTLALGLVSAVAWNALLVGAGFAVGANLDELEAFARRVGTTGLVVALVAVVLVGVAVLVRNRLSARRRGS